MADNQVTDKKLMSKHEFYFETPLYEWIEIDELEKGFLQGDVDAYSATNNIDTTYSISRERVNEYKNDPFYNYWAVTLKCKRKDNDTLCFIILEGAINNKTVYGKVGQWLSLADLQFAEIGKKYYKFLSSDEIVEFKRAIGLAAHGVGAGSFVYLRRIFENLIQQSYKSHSKDIDISASEFNAKRMEDKVELLKEYLPSQLVEMKRVYAILSKGVHELSEEDCRRYFSPLKLSIELILEQKIETEAKALRNKEVKKQLQKIHGEIARSNNG